MEAVKMGDVVIVHYTGKLSSGEVFDSSKERNPMEIKVGEGKIIPGFEQNLLGMKKGENKEFNLMPDEAFGERREENVHVVDKKHVPPDMNIEVGMQIALEAKGQEPIPAKIVDISGSTVTLDTNHPLAGKEIIFEVDLVEIKK